MDEDSASYPTGGDYHLEQMEAEGYPALLRIERGRVRNREIFGPMRLDYGFFKLQARQTSYCIARSMGQIVGAIGYTMDPVEHTVRVFELISLADDMVFYQVERLDIVKMVCLNRLQDLGPLDLTEPVQAVADVVMRGFSTCVIAPRMAQAIKEIPLFHGMNTEQATRLAGICVVRNITRG